MSMTDQSVSVTAPASGDDAPLPMSAADLLAYCRAAGLDLTLYEHEPVFTVAESTHLKQKIPGLHCRNLFLRDKKKNNFLVVAANETAIDLKKLAPLIGADRLSFGSAERLWEYLGVRPGSVCPFAIINDKAGAVRIILDKTMMDAPKVCYHPMENHLTVALAPGDLTRFVVSSGHVPEIVDLAAAAPDRP